MAIPYASRTLCVGRTRTGKSYLARALTLSAPAPRLIIDPSDSSLTAIPGAVTFHDTSSPKAPDGTDWTKAPTARFVPEDPDDLASYDQLYRWAFRAYPHWVWCDEAGDVLPANGTPRAGRRYLAQGAKRRLGHVAAHTRPVEISRHLIAQADHLAIFDLPHPEDREVLAKVAGVPARTLDAALAELAPREFIWWRQAEPGRLVISPPVTASIVEAEAAPREVRG